MKTADTYREAMRVISKCGTDDDPKAHAFAMASAAHSKGDMNEALRWTEIANAIERLLADIQMSDANPTGPH